MKVRAVALPAAACEAEGLARKAPGRNAGPLKRLAGMIADLEESFVGTRSRERVTRRMKRS